MTTYPDSVRYLYSLGNEVRTIKLGLERVGALMRRLGDPARSFRTVHVAGTNGKGSVAAMIEAGLREAGRDTGLYTSPHLVEPTERIRVNGTPVSEADFVRAFGTVHRESERMLAAGEIDGHPTYFETVTAMGFLLFQDLGVETAVIETGLGGRLDATNTVRPELCVITRVDYDHEAYLGQSLEAIAGEKAGILKPGVPAVFGQQRTEALRVLRRRAEELGIGVREASDWAVEHLEIRADGCRFSARRGEFLVSVECPLAGEHQVENALAAVAALAEMGLNAGQIHRGISATRWPGRLERVSEAPEIILDGAHNPAGIRALAAYIRRFYAGRHVWLVYGSMRDKSLDEIAGVLSRLADRVILTNPASRRALRVEVLEGLFDHSAVESAGSVAEALRRVAVAGPEVAVFVTGSLMVVGEARKLLVRRG